MLFGFTTGFIGEKYGVLHQFLYPEYLGGNNFLSFAFIGFSLGGFIMGFNLYTYILHGYRFPFTATLNRPFIKFSFNNFIIPVAYILVFLFYSYEYQSEQELLGMGQILFHLSGFISGLIAYILLTWVYFNYTNKNAEQIEKKKKNGAPIQTTIHKKRDWVDKESDAYSWKVETYMSSPFRIRLARESNHYVKTTLAKVFSQNHYNASIYEVILILSFISLGFFGESKLFAIPAAASGILFFTVIMMFISAIFSWIKGWTFTVLVFIFALLNYWSPSSSIIQVPNYAYGLDYNSEYVDYDNVHLKSISRDDKKRVDRENTLEILDRWKRKNSTLGNEKPKLIFVNCSGGGTRSALWTMRSLIKLDEALEIDLMKQTFMISGSSGGMIGASYLRELYHQSLNDPTIDFTEDRYQNDVCKDLLNPVMFSMATNDMFLRVREYDYEGRLYKKDRAYAFEKQLHINTRGFLDKKLMDYKSAELNSDIPLFVMAPTITNDGRRLIISAQDMSYLSTSSNSAIPEDIEFMRLFENQDSKNLRMSSALRMNATFPYILPMVTLPSDPPIRIMDAGLRDNYGLKTTSEFMFQFRDWINENTSGVLIIQTRDLPENFEKDHDPATIVNSFSAPLGSVYDNFINTQRYTNDQLFRYLESAVDEVDVVNLYLNMVEDQKVSLSWHLTQAEKNSIFNATESDDFKNRVEEIKEKLK